MICLGGEGRKSLQKQKNKPNKKQANEQKAKEAKKCLRKFFNYWKNELYEPSKN